MKPAAHAAAERFVEGPISATLARFALPLLAINLLHALAGTWGAVWVGQVLGANALAAVATTGVMMLMLMGAVMGMGSAAGVAIGQSLGAGDLRSVKRVVGSAVAFVVVFGFTVAVAGWFMAPTIVDGLGTPTAARQHAITHLRASCASMPSIFTYLVMVMMLRASGDSKTPLKFTLVWIALSAALGPLLLTGSWGFPKLGIAGLGVGSLLANAVALGALVLTIYLRRDVIALHGDDIRHLRPTPALVGLLLRRGLPMAAETLIVQGSYFALLAMVNAHGAATTAAYSAAAQLWAYVQLPSNALAASMSAMAAMNIGAGRWDRVGSIARRGCAMSFAISTAVSVAMLALGDAPLRLFIPEDGVVLAKAWQINLIVLWGWIALSASMGLFSIMRANGATVAPMVIFGITMWVFRVPFAWLLEPRLGEAAIWWSFPFGAACAAAMALVWYQRGSWRRKQLMMDEVTVSGEEGHVGE